MADDRTEEQQAADAVLHEAIQRVAVAYDLPPGSFITDWLVVGHSLSATTDGDRHHDFTLLQDGGERMSDPLLIGMLRAATMRAEMAYSEHLRDASE